MTLTHISRDLWPLNQSASDFRCAIYVISENRTEYIKVGIAQHPIRRLSTLQCGNPRKLFLEAVYEGSRQECRKAELRLHRFFKVGKGTEWFLVSAEGKPLIFDYLDSLCGGA